MRRWRGLVDLLREGLVAGSGALERAQKEGAALPFAVLEAVPVVRGPARAVHRVHDATVSLVHAAVRVAGQTVTLGAAEALAAVEGSRRDRRRRNGSPP